MHECCRQVEAEVGTNSRNIIYQTWSIDFSLSLYTEGAFPSPDHPDFLMAAQFSFMISWLRLCEKISRTRMVRRWLPRPPCRSCREACTVHGADVCLHSACRERRGEGGGELIRYYFISPTNEHMIEWSETGTPGKIGRKKRGEGGSGGAAVTASDFFYF